LEVIAAQNHGHGMKPNVVSVRVASRLTQSDWIHAGLKHKLVGQNLPAVALIEDDAFVLLS
jgi:hypothetical protein